MAFADHAIIGGSGAIMRWRHNGGQDAPGTKACTGDCLTEQSVGYVHSRTRIGGKQPANGHARPAVAPCRHGQVVAAASPDLHHGGGLDAATPALRPRLSLSDR